MQTPFFLLCVFGVVGQIQDLSLSRLKKSVFLTDIQLFTFGRADWPPLAGIGLTIAVQLWCAGCFFSCIFSEDEITMNMPCSCPDTIYHVLHSFLLSPGFFFHLTLPVLPGM